MDGFSIRPGKPKNDISKGWEKLPADPDWQKLSEVPPSGQGTLDKASQKPAAPPRRPDSARTR